MNYQHWITKYDAKYSALEVYSDINKRTADYVYFISAQADYILLSENLLLIVGEKEVCYRIIVYSFFCMLSFLYKVAHKNDIKDKIL